LLPGVGCRAQFNASSVFPFLTVLSIIAERSGGNDLVLLASEANCLRSVTARKKLISANYPIIKQITEEKGDCLCILHE